MTDLYSQPYSEDAIKEQTKTWAELEAEKAEKPEDKDDEVFQVQEGDEVEFVETGDDDDEYKEDSLSDYVTTSEDFREDSKE